LEEDIPLVWERRWRKAIGVWAGFIIYLSSGLLLVLSPVAGEMTSQCFSSCRKGDTGSSRPINPWATHCKAAM